MNIPAIETGVLPPPDSYLDRDNNIPLEDGDQPPPPLPAEIDLIWQTGHPWPYVPDAPNGGGRNNSQPPSMPPSPGLSYRTPRTPSLRHRLVIPSHHTPSHHTSSCHSSGNRSSRSHMLTEPEDFSSRITEESQSQPVFVDTGVGSRWDYEITMSDGTIWHRPVSPQTASKLMILITMSDGRIGHHPASPRTVDHLVEETSRAMAHRQALESPLAPQSLAIPQSEIASYPREWCDGTCSCKYSYIPSYQGWH